MLKLKLTPPHPFSDTSETHFKILLREVPQSNIDKHITAVVKNHPISAAGSAPLDCGTHDFSGMQEDNMSAVLNITDILKRGRPVSHHQQSTPRLITHARGSRSVTARRQRISSHRKPDTLRSQRKEHSVKRTPSLATRQGRIRIVARTLMQGARYELISKG